MDDRLGFAADSGVPTSARHDRDHDLVRQVLEGGLPGEHAGLELLLRRRPESWEEAVSLLKPHVAPPSALIGLGEAWRTYRRIERSEAARER